MKKILVFVLAVIMISCGKDQATMLTVKNTLDISRTETVSVSIESLKLEHQPAAQKTFQVRDEATGKLILSQSVDSNMDNVIEELLFQVSLAPGEEKKFGIILTEDKPDEKLSDTRTFARFVPERIDDIAWENDLVAFRTYGPEAQRLVDAGEKGGTLSSGLDCWLKRVNYPIIDKWYKKYVDGGTYHKDDGEGYDPYHVGASRGCGGIGVWLDDSLYVSKNFITHKIIENGPIRTTFQLEYAPWKAGRATVTEKKIISIDKGSQLYLVEGILGNSDSIPNCTIGITLHDKKGVTNVDSVKGWFRYWEPIDDAEIGTAVVVDPSYIIGHRDYRTAKKDLSQLYVITKPQAGTVRYYTGFAWSKAGVITTPQAWDQYLSDFSLRLKTPVEIKIEK